MGKTLKELRARVRKHLASMDETPAPRVKFDAQAYSDQLWEKVQRNKPTGRRETVIGRADGHGHDVERRGVPTPPANGIDALADVLRDLATFTKEGRMTIVTYHDGEREPLNAAASFLASVTGRNRLDIFAAVKLLYIP